MYEARRMGEVRRSPYSTVQYSKYSTSTVGLDTNSKVVTVNL
jgi:hypothetical protein